MNITHRIALLPGLLVVFASLEACTMTYDAADIAVKDYPAEPKLVAQVDLRLSAEFRKHATDLSFGADTQRLALGETLARNAESMARALFSDVIVTSGTADAPSSGRLVLIPAVSAVDRSMGATAFGESLLTVMLEWTALDAQNRLVWVDTIRGDGKRNTGNIFTASGNREEQFEQALNALFRASYATLRGAPELRRVTGGSLAGPTR